jgi:hypothetical protein
MALNEAVRVSLRMNLALNRAMKTFVQESLRELIKATPVKTGWAQSNWIAYVGNAPLDPVGSKKRVNYGPQKRSFRKIRRHNFVKSTKPLIITNNVPYIGKLNEGYSTQAPAGFVDEIFKRVAIAVGGRRFR